MGVSLPMAARRSARAAQVTSWLLIASLASPLVAHGADSAPAAPILLAAADAASPSAVPNSDTESLRRELQQEKERIQVLEQRFQFVREA